MPEPKHNKGRSKQDYCTPPEFLEAVLRRKRIPLFDMDLAASHANAISCAESYYTKEQDALAQPWYRGSGWNWCNPPYTHIEPWVRRAYQQSCLDDGAKTLMLLPAGVGSNWFRDWVHEKAKVIFLNGRITFVGATDAYPKDCILLEYQPGCWCNDYSVWSWPLQ